MFPVTVNGRSLLRYVTRRGSVTLSVTLACLLLFGACDQAPDVDERPMLSVEAPGSFTSVFTEEAVPLQVQARSEDVSRVDRVTVNGQAMTYNEDTGVWEDSLRFDGILNRFILRAYLGDERVDRDTVHAAYLDYDVRQAPPIPDRKGRGGLTVTRLEDGMLLLAGGTSGDDVPAERPTIYRLDANLASSCAQARKDLDSLITARTGHTATLLPDGRVLFLGGSRTGDLQSASDLVETAEIYDPAKECNKRVAAVPVRGVPVRRALHTADLRLVEGDPVIDVVGGRGDAGDGLEARQDLRRFIFRNDSLIAVDDSSGLTLAEQSIFGHTQTALRASSNGQTRYLIAGTNFLGSSATDASFLADLRNVPDFQTRALPQFFRTQRTRHAAVRLGPGLVLLMGGYQFAPQTALSSVELYADGLKRTFLLELPEEEAQLFGARYGHVALRRGEKQILILGGFSRAGSGLHLSALFEVNNLEE